MLHRHATDVVALVAGTIFAGLAAVWLLIITDAVDVEQAWIGGPVILIVAGILGLLVTLTPSRSEPAPVLQPAADDSLQYDEPMVEDTSVIPTADDEPTTVLPSDDPDDLAVDAESDRSDR